MRQFLFLWLLVHAVGRLPRRLLYAGADVGGTLAWYASARLRDVTRGHMRHVLGGDSDSGRVDAAARGCVRSAARYWADFARGAHVSAQQAFADAAEFPHVDRFFRALDRGCGLVLFSAHLGSPEHLFRAASYLGLDMLVLTEPLSPPRVHNFVHAVRAAPGVRFAPADMGGVRQALSHLRAGGVVAVLADRDIQGNGRPVEFFGELASLPTGPVELARRTQATLLPVFALRSPGARLRVSFGEPVAVPRTDDRRADVDAGLRALASTLEEGIRRAPDQWFALHPVWSGAAR